MKIENLELAKKLTNQREQALTRIERYNNVIASIKIGNFQCTDLVFDGAKYIALSAGGSMSYLEFNVQSIINLLEQNLTILENRVKELEGIIETL